jgi:glycosyltransferase involved in cell wall biosynthesis
VTRPRLLLVLHNFHSWAGTEQHTKTLASELCAVYEIAFVFPHHGSVVLRYQDSGEEISFPGARLPWPLTPPREPVMERSLQQILEKFRPSMIHIQHALNWPLDVIDWLCDTGIPVVMSFHDYFALTPLVTMIGTEDSELALSEKYVKDYFGADIRGYLIARQYHLRAAFSKLRYRIVPSVTLSEILQRRFPADYRVIPHGIRPFQAPIDRCRKDTVRFGYLGSMISQKGWPNVAAAWPLVHAAHPSAQLHFFGGTEPASGLPEGAFAHGVYDPSDLPNILSQFHLGVLPSTFAETFSLALSELQLAGLPVAASRMGVFRERISIGETGWLFDPFSIENIAQVLAGCIANQSWRNWRIPAPRLAVDMAREYDNLYRRC